MAEAKTNPQRMLEREHIAYTAHSYDISDGRLDGISVAEKCGFDPATVFKTLAVRGATKTVYVFVVPVLKELQLKLAARSVGEKSIEMLHVKEITPVTGYVKGGCSPIGMKKSYQTVVDISALNLSEMVVSAGRIGLQMKLAPESLKKMTGCVFDKITD